MIDVKTFYDEHPINEADILAKLADEGKSAVNITAADLWPYDQDHYGGLEANDALAAAIKIEAGNCVLDLCSGMGGPEPLSGG